ncbi:hypothetical protein, partial [Desulfosporosinus fructosivorans]
SFLWGGQDSRQIGHPWPLPAGNILVSRPADERGLKPSLATTTAKASERVSADPLGWGRRRGTGDGPVSSAAGKAGDGEGGRRRNAGDRERRGMWHGEF